MRVWLTVAGWALVASIAGAAGWFWFVCPCERTPGGPLSGERRSVAIDDWSFANDVDLCQIEVDRGIAWSVNLNCMADDSGALYLSCARCDGKAWSTAAISNSAGRIRIDGKVYPVTLTRVEEGGLLDVAWQARANKLGRGRDTKRPDHWWSFQITSRSDVET